jgi:hypothetical protein
LAIVWILFAFLIVLTRHVAFLESLVPKWMIKAIYPIDKSDLDMLRFTHFLAVALVVTRYLPRHWAPLTSKWLRPLILCGQHSLPIFCFSVFLSFWGALDPDAVHQRGLGATRSQRGRHPDHGCGGVAPGSGREGPQSVRRARRARRSEGSDRIRESVMLWFRRPGISTQSRR